MLKNNGFHNRHSPILRAFSPLSLFAGGAPGAWYDPSDYGATGTLFQDSAGTTPVTAVEQPVGLMLDKSQGLVLGSELVSTLNTSSAWTKVGNNIVTQDGSEVRIEYVDNATGAQAILSSTNGLSQNLVTGRWYKLSFQARISTGSANLIFENGAGNQTIAVLTATALTTFTYTFLYDGFARLKQTGMSTGEVVWVSSNSVKELAGNHAFQATSASRPVLSARYNLLTKTEQFDDAVWPKSAVTVTANAALAPDGTNTADKIIATATNANHLLNRTTTFSATSGQAYTHSLCAKAGEYNFVRLQFQASGFASSAFANFNLATGNVGIVGATATASISPEGNGWYRCVITVTATGTASSGVQPFVLSSNAAEGAEAFLGDGTSGVYIWGASLVPANQSTLPYQRVNTSTDYNTTGFLPYLKFDGVDDSLSTNSISFTSTDKMSVFAGVRKLVDTFQMYCELSASISANNGTFLLYGGGTGTQQWLSKGTVAVDVGSTPITAPITQVLTGVASISTDVATLRINGTQAATSAADQGTGNYGNYPLFVGSRNNASQRFNGYLYSMVIVGKAVTAGELSSTETYVANKTGVTL